MRGVPCSLVHEHAQGRRSVGVVDKFGCSALSYVWAPWPAVKLGAQHEAPAKRAASGGSDAQPALATVSRQDTGHNEGAEDACRRRRRPPHLPLPCMMQTRTRTSPFALEKCARRCS